MGTIRDMNGNVVGEIDNGKVFGKPFLCVYGKKKPRNWSEATIERPLADGLTAYVRFEASSEVLDILRNKHGDSIGATVIATKDHLQLLGISEDELFEQADKNTTPRVRQIDEVVEAMGGPALNTGMPFFVVESKRDSYGAGILASEGFLNWMYEHIGAFTIIPSSIHEIIVVPQELALQAEEMCEMIREVNSTEVLEKDQLSDIAYMYDKTGLHTA